MIEKFPTWLRKLLKKIILEVHKLLVKSWKGCEYVNDSFFIDSICIDILYICMLCKE